MTPISMTATSIIVALGLFTTGTNFLDPSTVQVSLEKKMGDSLIHRKTIVYGNLPFTGIYFFKFMVAGPLGVLTVRAR